MTAVELAMAAPLLLAALSPMVDLGLAFSQQVQVQQAAQAGAQYALLHGANMQAIADAVVAATSLPVTAQPAPAQSCGCPSGTGIAAADCSLPCGNGETPGTYVTIHARASYTPVLPYSLFGDGMLLNAQTMIRIQ